MKLLEGEDRASRVTAAHSLAANADPGAVVADFPTTVERVCAFLGIPSVETLKEWHPHATVSRHPARTAPAGPIHSNSIGRWKAPEHQDILREFMERPEAVSPLEHHGYFDET